MEWIVEQRDPAGEWFTRATLMNREDAEERARLFKSNNPKLRFRYRPVDDEGEPFDAREPVEV